MTAKDGLRKNFKGLKPKWKIYFKKIAWAGGMAAVWSAYDEILQIDVALKIYYKNSLNREKFERIKREVLKGRTLSHKNVSHCQIK